MPVSCLFLKLLQKPHIVLVKKSNVIDAVFKHGHPLNAHAESKTFIFTFRISNGIKNFRVDHAAT